MQLTGIWGAGIVVVPETTSIEQQRNKPAIYLLLELTTLMSLNMLSS